jgi:cell division protein FtsW (lipid II flippase)
MLNKLGQQSKVSPDRHFGMVFAVLFVILSFTAYRKDYGTQAIVGCLIIAAIFGLTAWLKPALLKPLNLAWHFLGEVMGTIVTPITLGLIFFLIFTPYAIAGRMFKRDVLRLKFDHSAQTYWVDREVPKSEADSFKVQF